MHPLRFDHVAVAVHSIKPALKLFKDTLGGSYLMGGEVADSWRWFQLRYPGGGKVELLEPLKPGFVSDFLDSRGEGLHHITFKTDDIKASISHITAMGYELVDIDTDSAGWKEAFFRPKGAHGTLIQVAQSDVDDEQAKQVLKPSNLDELLG